jgi:acylpyruvate hydrolase
MEMLDEACDHPHGQRHRRCASGRIPPRRWVPDVGSLLARPDWLDVATTSVGRTWLADEADFAPLILQPSKVVCVGHNYRDHIREIGREMPAHPTLFAKFADSLTGANDDIVKPTETEAWDWEVELAVIVGSPVRRATVAQAESAIAGFTVMNDVTARDWQFRTIPWTQGKVWDSSSPLGHYLVTPDEVKGGVRPDVEVRTLVDGEVMQRDRTGTLLFDPVTLVQYVSTVVRLNPGDVIATGTPAGVGHAREPHVYLLGGETVVTEIEGIGACVNRVVTAVPS